MVAVTLLWTLRIMAIDNLYALQERTELGIPFLRVWLYTTANLHLTSSAVDKTNAAPSSVEDRKAPKEARRKTYDQSASYRHPAPRSAG